MGTSGSEKRVSEIWRLGPLHSSMGRSPRPPVQGFKLHPYPQSAQRVSGMGFRGPYLGGCNPEGLGNLGVELADVGKPLDLARGAAMRQLRAEDEARAGAGCGRGIRGRGRGRRRARGLGPPGLASSCALHGQRSSATRATAATGSAASCSLPSPGPGRNSRTACVRGSGNPSRRGRRHHEVQGVGGGRGPGVLALPGPAACSPGTPSGLLGPELRPKPHDHSARCTHLILAQGGGRRVTLVYPKLHPVPSLPTALQHSHLSQDKTPNPPCGPQSLHDLPCPIPALTSSLFPPHSLCSSNTGTPPLLQHARHGPAPGPL